jgi:hypothetical protein
MPLSSTNAGIRPERSDMAQAFQNTNQHDEHLRKYYLIELSQVIERINAIENSRVQLAVFIGTANLTALGIAVTVNKAAIVFIAAVILLLFVIVDRRLRTLNAAYFYRGIQLQRKFAPHDGETFLQITPGRLASEVRRIAELERLEERIKLLAKFPTPFRGFAVWIPLMGVVGEVVSGLVLLQLPQWTLF